MNLTNDNIIETPALVKPNLNIEDTWLEVEHYFPMKPNTNEPAVLAWNKVGKGIYKLEGTYGISLQEDDLCLDADPRNYPPDKDSLSEFFDRFRINPTRAVSTPSGGWHIRYKKPPGIKIRKTQPEFPGIEFRSRNQCIVGPGCFRNQKMSDGRHVQGYYVLKYGGPPILLPEHVLEALEQQSDAVSSRSEADTLTGYSLLELPKFKAICQAADGIKQGNRGFSALKLAMRGRDLNLSPETTYEVMGAEWDWRNEPPMEDKHLWNQVQNGYKYAKNPQGVESPENKFEAPEAPVKLSVVPDSPKTIEVMEYQHDEVKKTLFQDQLTPKLDKSGAVVGIQNTQGNVIYILRHSKYWIGRLRYNQFADRTEVVGRPIWRRDQSNKDSGMNTGDFEYIQGWLSANPEYMIEVPIGRIESACRVAATPFHPVRDYLNSLEWDGQPRLDTMLPDSTGCVDNAYTRAAGKCILISAVKRIFEPGCKQDYLLVLESEQGTKKSTWVEALGGEWYSTGELIPNDKDTYQALRGKWFIELPEIDNTFTKTEFAWLKKTITTSSDTYRPSYGRVAETVPRESIFIATLNPGASGEYLRDIENRRYWPIATGRFDIALLKEQRDQYFAEAKVRYDNKEASWIDDPEVQSLAKKEQEARREKDPWIEALRGWTANQMCFMGREVYDQLGFTGKDISGHAKKRVHSVLKELGFEYNSGVHLWQKKGFDIERTTL